MSPRPLFHDREEAGRAVAAVLIARGIPGAPLVLGMARGGVAVARPVADALGVPLDAMVARKLGVPGIPEAALGAIAEGWPEVVQDAVGWFVGVPPRVVDAIAARERTELARRVRLYRGDRPLPDVRGRTVVLVDDGLVTGATLRAAARALRVRRPARLVIAVPVAAAAGVDELHAEVDELIAVATPDPFGTVSDWYEHFAAIGDDDVLRTLGRARASVPSGLEHAGAPGPERAVSIALDAVDGGALEGDVGVPESMPPSGLVVLVHGGGSSRNGYRNRYLAGRLRLAGWATLRLDLLLERERPLDADGALRFDVPRIARRLLAAVDWATRERVPGAGRMVLFGASTGAAAALLAAAERPGLVRAVASRGGRVDLAGDALERVRAPVLLAVGGEDRETQRLNREAMRRLRGEARLLVVPNAGHAFEEAGVLGALGEQVVRWLERLPPGDRPAWRPPGLVALLRRVARLDPHRRRGGERRPEMPTP